MQQDSYDLEQCLLDWENKPDDLKAQLEQSIHNEAMREDYRRQPASLQVTIEGLERHIKRMQTQAMERQEVGANSLLWKLELQEVNDRGIREPVS